MGMSRYAESHLWANLTGPGDARPTALQIVQDYSKIGSLEGKTILVTGVSSGIGIPTAVALAATGATTYFAARDLDKARAALHAIGNSPKVHFVHLDTSSFASVRSCAADVLAKTRGQLNILVNNVGILVPAAARTEDGFETQLETNYLGPFLLFNLLKDALLASATASFPSRVVNVSSVGHKESGIVFDNLNLDEVYNPMVAYGQSKTALIYMASEIERRCGGQDLHAWSLQPGGVLGTSFGNQFDPTAMEEKASAFPHRFFKSAEQGAATTVWAAVADEPLRNEMRGRYLEDCALAKPMAETENAFLFGYADFVYDNGSAEKLWVLSEELVGLKAKGGDS